MKTAGLTSKTSKHAQNCDAFEQRSHCVFCQADLSQAKPAIRSEAPAETMALDGLKIHWGNYSSRRPFFTYVRCRVCRGLYCSTVFTDAQLAALYKGIEENVVEAVPLQARRKTQKGYLKFLSRFSPLTGSYLEIGPDSGLFTGLCVEKGAVDGLWLYEPNEDVHADLRNAVGNHACQGTGTTGELR